jgi:seryl-tRNA synthetase
MLQIGLIRENKEEVIRKLAIKNFNAEEILGDIIVLDDKRRDTQKRLDDGLAEANLAAKAIGGLYQKGLTSEANSLKQKTAELKILTRDLSAQLDEIISRMNELLVQLPNLPHSSVPPGHSAADNEVVFEWGSIPELAEGAKPHWDLASEYDIIDFELGNKVTGAGFPFYKGKGAKLQRALINFFLEEAIGAGFTEFQPPLFVNEIRIWNRPTTG